MPEPEEEHTKTENKLLDFNCFDKECHQTRLKAIHPSQRKDCCFMWTVPSVCKRVYLWHSSLSLGVKWRLEELKGRCLEACCSSCWDRGVIPQFQRSEKFVQSTKFCIHPSGPLQSRECEAAGDNHMLSKCSSKSQSLLYQIIHDHHMYLTTTGGRALISVHKLLRLENV